jgi:dolichol-phosphate mannosyltransferase
MAMAEVSFVLPALNEGKSIGAVLDRIPVHELGRRGHRVQVWVLDGRSTDHTVQVALEKGARIFRQSGRGKGNAVSEAFSVLKTDYVIMLDADNTYDPRDMLPMMELLEDGHDVVMGSRMRGRLQEGAISLKNMLGNKLLTTTASVLYRKRVSDLCTGFWGFKGHVLGDLGIDAKGFELEAQMFSRCAKSKFVVGEVPISYGCRDGDETKLDSMSAGMRIFWTLFWERLRPRWLLRGQRRASAAAPGLAQTNSAKFAPETK